MSVHHFFHAKTFICHAKCGWKYLIYLQWRTQFWIHLGGRLVPSHYLCVLGGNRTFPWDPARHNLTPNLLSAQKDVNSDWVQVLVIMKIVHCSCVATQMTCGRLQPRHLVYVCVDCVLWKNYSWQKFAPVILPQKEVPSCYIVRLWRDLLPFAIFQMKSFLAYCKSLFVSQKCSLCWFLFNMFNVSFCWRQ